MIRFNRLIPVIPQNLKYKKETNHFFRILTRVAATDTVRYRTGIERNEIKKILYGTVLFVHSGTFVEFQINEMFYFEMEKIYIRTYIRDVGTNVR